MTSFDDFVDSTALFIAGFTNTQEQVTYITEPLTNADASVTVADGSIISPGSVIEVGSELIHVASVASNTVTFSPFGRGYRGTTAASHVLNAKVTVSPVVPRSMIEKSINDAIGGVWPIVFGVSVHTFTYTPAKSTYALPAGAVNVLSVSYDTVGPTEEWVPVRRYRVDPNADPTDFASGASISLYDLVDAGRTVKVVYTHAPSALTSGDVFTDCGLRDTAQDLVRYGAAYRLAPWFDMGHAPGVNAEANYAAGLGRPVSSSTVSRLLVQTYQLRLQEEAAALHALYPIRSHYTR